MISMFEFVMACLSACSVWKISSSGNFECWQSGRRFLGSCKQPVIRPSMPWACRRKRCLRGYPLQDRFPWIVFTYSFSSSILMFFWWPPVRLACLGHAVRKVVASKTPYHDRDGAILFFFCFFVSCSNICLYWALYIFWKVAWPGSCPASDAKFLERRCESSANLCSGPDCSRFWFVFEQASANSNRLIVHTQCAWLITSSIGY